MYVCMYVCMCMYVSTCFAMGIEGSEDDVAVHGGDLDYRSGDRFQSQVRHCDFLREICMHAMCTVIHKSVSIVDNGHVYVLRTYVWMDVLCTVHKYVY